MILISSLVQIQGNKSHYVYLDQIQNWINVIHMYKKIRLSLDKFSICQD